MENPTVNTPAESSPAVTIEVPSDATAYTEWRQTGKLPNAAESAPAKKSSDSAPSGEEEGDRERESAPESETGKVSEHKPSKAERRLNELLEDLRKAGLSPAELKTFKREAAKAAAEPEAKPKSEPTAKPADDGAPKKPKEADFKTWEEYEAARDEYFEALADYKAQKAVESDRAKTRQEAAEREMTERLNQAKARYKDDNADQTIVAAAKEIFTQDSPVPAVIREVLNESEHLVDVLYTLGKDQESLSEFLDLCKTAPGKAMRKAVLIEKLVMEELGGEKVPAERTPERGSDGKFVSSKKETKAPPPPKEVSGRSGPPSDERERAIESGDFASYRAAANRRDLARLQGR